MKHIKNNIQFIVVIFSLTIISMLFVFIILHNNKDDDNKGDGYEKVELSDIVPVIDLNDASDFDFESTSDAKAKVVGASRKIKSEKIHIDLTEDFNEGNREHPPIKSEQNQEYK